MAKIFNILMLVLYLGYFASSSFFVHQHRQKDVTIVHSHPYKDARHGHSAAQLQLINILQDRTSTEAVDFSLPECAQQQHNIIKATEPYKSSPVCNVAVPQLRAPPML